MVSAEPAFGIDTAALETGDLIFRRGRSLLQPSGAGRRHRVQLFARRPAERGRTRSRRHPCPPEDRRQQRPDSRPGRAPIELPRSETRLGRVGVAPGALGKGRPRRLGGGGRQTLRPRRRDVRCPLRAGHEGRNVLHRIGVEGLLGGWNRLGGRQFGATRHPLRHTRCPAAQLAARQPPSSRNCVPGTQEQSNTTRSDP